MNELRYVLFGSDETWSALPEYFRLSSNDIQDCFDWAAVHGNKFSLVIDRHYPKVPIYLDRDNHYQPLTDMEKL